jgi:hypothetical protein
VSRHLSRGHLLPIDPLGVQLCEYSDGKPTAHRPIEGVVLTAGPASALAALIDAEPRAGTTSTSCSALGETNSVLLHFSYQSGSGAEVEAVAHGCLQPMALVSGQTRLLDDTLSEYLIASGISYGLPGPGAPDLYGDDLSTATRAATKAGFTIGFGGEEIDTHQRAGAVLLQFPPAGESDIGNQIQVITAAHREPACVIGSIAAEYYGGGAGAGNDFGSIDIRDVGAQPCLLQGPVKVVGTDAAGHPVTQAITYPVAPALVLSPHGNAIPVGGTVPLGEVVAVVQIAAEYRDDSSSPDGLCTEHQIVPALWQLIFSDGVEVVMNASDDPGYPAFSSLVTCRGELDAPTTVAAE